MIAIGPVLRIYNVGIYTAASRIASNRISTQTQLTLTRAFSAMLLISLTVHFRDLSENPAGLRPVARGHRAHAIVGC